jgi:hypothetical protein
MSAPPEPKIGSIELAGVMARLKDVGESLDSSAASPSATPSVILAALAVAYIRGFLEGSTGRPV